MGTQLQTKAENMKDKFLTYRFHQRALLWEELNNAFRYLLGEDDYALDGELRIPHLRDNINQLRQLLDEFLTEMFESR